MPGNATIVGGNQPSFAHGVIGVDSAPDHRHPLLGVHEVDQPSSEVPLALWVHDVALKDCAPICSYQDTWHPLIFCTSYRKPRVRRRGKTTFIGKAAHLLRFGAPTHPVKCSLRGVVLIG